MEDHGRVPPVTAKLAKSSLTTESIMAGYTDVSICLQTFGSDIHLQLLDVQFFFETASIVLGPQIVLTPFMSVIC